MYERQNGRSPARDFLEELEKPMLKKFAGQFDAITKMGSAYCNHERFRPLHGYGKPLWELKEFDHRQYCVRNVWADAVTLVLLNGWVKGKEGKTEKEKREIERALGLYQEFICEFPGGVLS